MLCSLVYISRTVIKWYVRCVFPCLKCQCERLLGIWLFSFHVFFSLKTFFFPKLFINAQTTNRKNGKTNEPESLSKYHKLVTSTERFEQEKYVKQLKKICRSISEYSTEVAHALDACESNATEVEQPMKKNNREKNENLTEQPSSVHWQTALMMFEKNNLSSNNCFQRSFW